MKAATEEQIPMALVGDIRAPRIGGRIFADTAVLDTLQRAALVFLPLALVTTLGLYFFYHISATANRHILEAGQEKIVQMGRATINASLNALAADVSFLSQEGMLQEWFTTGDPTLKSALTAQYVAFALHKREYDKVRFIDVEGHEQARTDRLGGAPQIVSDDMLQDKSDRPFVAAALGLAAGEIYISPFDLNVENGAIELPIKPTIRAATPVFDHAGQKRGIVVLNHIGAFILDRIRALSTHGEGRVWLVNSDSFWLLGPRPAVEWSFAIPGRDEFTFAKAFPAAWDKIKRASRFGQFTEGGDLFSFVPIFAPATSEEGVAIVSAPVWYLIAHVSAAAASQDASGLLPNLGIALGGALLLLATLALLIGHQRTRRHQAEQQVLLLNRQLASDNDALQMLNHELETFSYSVSHDLRGPLRAIDGFSRALLDDYSEALDETGRDHLARVRNAAQHMGELIDDLLTLSQVGRAELNLVENVDLTEIASTIMDSLQRTDPARDVEFMAEPGIRARCDPRMLRIVLENLFGNAWKFTLGKKPAIIEFGRVQTDGETAYFVRDNGVGFDMAHAGKLFGAFQRLHSSTEFPGTGIGLASVKRMIGKHGGRAWAEARPKEGATLFFTLASAELA